MDIKRIYRRISIIVFVSGLALAGLSTVSGCAKSSLTSLFRKEPADDSIAVDVTSVPLTIWSESYATAARESADTGKPILADFTGSDWCHWCQKLDADVFESAEFKRWAADHVVLLKLDFPKRGTQSPEMKQQNAELAKRYGIKGYPTVILLDSQGTALGRMGYMSSATAWIEKAKSQLTQTASKKDFPANLPTL